MSTHSPELCIQPMAEPQGSVSVHPLPKQSTQNRGRRWAVNTRELSSSSSSSFICSVLLVGGFRVWLRVLVGVLFHQEPQTAAVPEPLGSQ